MNQALSSITLQAATRIAASGDYLTAITLLDMMGPEEPPLGALLLRAKIFAQQGRLDEAIGVWRKVQEKEPENQEARAGIARAEKLRARPGGARWPGKLIHAIMPASLVGVAFLVLIALVLGTARFGSAPSRAMIARQDQDLSTLKSRVEQLMIRTEDMRGFATSIPPAVSPSDFSQFVERQNQEMSDLRLRLDKIIQLPEDLRLTVRSLSSVNSAVEFRQMIARQDQQIRDLGSKVDQIISPSKDSSQPPPPPLIQGETFGLPGITTTEDRGRLRLTFDQGLFAGGSEQIRSEKISLLNTLGQRLKDYPKAISIHVIGSTDDVPLATGGRFRDNGSLGLARAVAVVERLKTSSGLPLSAFSMCSGGDERTPFPNDTTQNRARNRSVMIELTPR